MVKYSRCGVGVWFRWLFVIRFNRVFLGKEFFVLKYGFLSEFLERYELGNNGVELGCILYIKRKKLVFEFMKLILCIVF